MGLLKIESIPHNSFIVIMKFREVFSIFIKIELNKTLKLGISQTGITGVLEPWHRNCAAAGAGLRSCPAAWRCHMNAGGGSQNTTTGSCWQSLSLYLLHAAFDR
jgi:hypothetical protein